MPFINFDEFRECPIFKFFTLLAYTLLIYIINFCFCSVGGKCASRCNC